MARRFVRGWFDNEVREIKDDSPGGRQIIARGTVNGGYDPTRTSKHGGAYSRGWDMEALAVPIEQIEQYNALHKHHGTGVTFVPTKDGGYCKPTGESRSSRNALLRLEGKIDFDGGYSDHTGCSR